MKQVTASEARKHWFRLLDEVAGGDTLRVPDAEEADRWGRRWEGEEG